MTAIKIESKTSSSASNALTRHAEALYNTLGSRRLGIVELARVEATFPDPSEDREPSVRLRLAGLEIATPEQEDNLRQAMLALHLHRTATGTLDEAGLHLSPGTIEDMPTSLHAAEAARLRVGLVHWAGYARRAMHVENMTLSEARHELDAIAVGLEALTGLVEERPA
jgi:hypothetical protein